MPHIPLIESDSKVVRDMKRSLSNFETEEGRFKGLSYQPRPNDVVIATTPKAGTTWVQQICHQLRSAPNGGDMTFNEISQVVPFLELAHDQKQDLEAPQYGNDQLRLFKTHFWEPHCPKFPSTIVVFRHPYDVLISFYHFFEDWAFEANSMSLDTFAREFWLARGVPTSKMQNASYFHWVVSWFQRHQDPSVLFVFYEDLQTDLKGQVQRIATFLSNSNSSMVRLDQPEYVELAAKRSTFEFMLEHAWHFDEKLSKLARNEACGFPKEQGLHKSKVRLGTSGHGAVQLSSEIRSAIDTQWNEIVTPATGCMNYNAFHKLFLTVNQNDS